MCGFTGLINLNGKVHNSSLDQKMDSALKRLHPRGPNQQDQWKDQNAFIVHARLSIIDTSSLGKQPMVKYNKVVAYNGEIYNFKELRKELQKNGYNFTSESDCEVLYST